MSVVSVSDFFLPLRLELRFDALSNHFKLYLYRRLFTIIFTKYLCIFVIDDLTDIARSNMILPFTLGVNASLISFNSGNSLDILFWLPMQTR